MHLEFIPDELWRDGRGTLLRADRWVFLGRDGGVYFEGDDVGTYEIGCELWRLCCAMRGRERGRLLDLGSRGSMRL